MKLQWLAEERDSPHPPPPTWPSLVGSGGDPSLTSHMPLISSDSSEERIVALRCDSEVFVQDSIRTQLQHRNINADCHFVLTTVTRTAFMTIAAKKKPESPEVPIFMLDPPSTSLSQDDAWYALNVHVGIYPYCAGGDVNSTLGPNSRQRKMKLDDSVRCFIQVAESLHLLHDLHILHRDIKPSNILIDAHGRYLIGDFTTCGSLGQGSSWTPDRILVPPSMALPATLAPSSGLSSTAASTASAASSSSCTSTPSSASTHPSHATAPLSFATISSLVPASESGYDTPSRAPTINESLQTDWSCWAQLMLQMLEDVSDIDYMKKRAEWGGKEYKEVCEALRNLAKSFHGLESLVSACLADESSYASRLHAVLLKDPVVATWKVILDSNIELNAQSLPDRPDLESVLLFVNEQANTTPRLYSRLFQVLRYITTTNKNELLRFVGNLDSWRLILSLAANLLDGHDTEGCRDALFVLAYFMAELERNQLYKELRQVQIVAMDTRIGDLLPRFTATEAASPSLSSSSNHPLSPATPHRRGESGSSAVLDAGSTSQSPSASPSLNSSLLYPNNASNNASNDASNDACSSIEALNDSLHRSLTLTHSSQSSTSSSNDGNATSSLVISAPSSAPQSPPSNPPQSGSASFNANSGYVSSSSIAVTIITLLCVRNVYWTSKFFNGSSQSIDDYLQRASEVSGLFPDLTCFLIASVLDERFVSQKSKDLLSPQTLEPVSRIFRFLCYERSWHTDRAHCAELAADLVRLIALDVIHNKTSACVHMRISLPPPSSLSRSSKVTKSILTLLQTTILPLIAKFINPKTIDSLPPSGRDWGQVEATVRLAIPRMMSSLYIPYNLSVRGACNSPPVHPSQRGLDLGVTPLLQDVMEVHASPLCGHDLSPQGSANQVKEHRCLRCAPRAMQVCSLCKMSNLRLVELWSSPDGLFECPGDAEDAETELSDPTPSPSAPQLEINEPDEAVPVTLDTESTSSEHERYCRHFDRRFSSHLLPPYGHELVHHRSPQAQEKGYIVNDAESRVLIAHLDRSTLTTISPSLRSSTTLATSSLDTSSTHGSIPSSRQAQLNMKAQRDEEVRGRFFPSEGTLGEYAEVSQVKTKGRLPTEAWFVVIPTETSAEDDDEDHDPYMVSYSSSTETNPQTMSESHVRSLSSINFPFIGFSLLTGDVVYLSSNSEVQRFPYGPHVDYRHAIGLGVTVHGDVFTVTPRGVLPLLNLQIMNDLHPSLRNLNPILANYNMAMVMTPHSKVRVLSESKLLSAAVLSKRAISCPLHHIASSPHAHLLLPHCGQAEEFLEDHKSKTHKVLSSMGSLRSLNNSMASLPNIASPPQQGQHQHQHSHPNQHHPQPQTPHRGHAHISSAPNLETLSHSDHPILPPPSYHPPLTSSAPSTPSSSQNNLAHSRSSSGSTSLTSPNGSFSAQHQP